jgi:hypothetical protein
MEPLASGRPWTGRLVYVMVLAVLAGFMSVLGARNPGGGAWALLMVLLLVVLLIPWLEAAGRVRRFHGLGWFRLDSPWDLFYGLLAMVGVTNYVPTRYGPAACMMGLGLVLEYFGLRRSDWPPATRAALWPAVAWTLAAACGLAAWKAEKPCLADSGVERLWLWFRDHWGVVWALRTQERFNRTAELGRWPVRLSWFGLAQAGEAASSSGATGEANARPAVLATLRGLIRRFMTPERMDAIVSAQGGPACFPGQTEP